jgi:hypothetical protein
MHSSVICLATLSASDDDISCQLELIYYPAGLSSNNAPSVTSLPRLVVYV